MQIKAFITMLNLIISCPTDNCFLFNFNSFHLFCWNENFFKRTAKNAKYAKEGKRENITNYLGLISIKNIQDI